MENDRITIRLPPNDLKQIDVLIQIGEASTRSEVIRHAVKEYLDNHTTRILERVEQFKKLQEFGAAGDKLAPYIKK